MIIYLILNYMYYLYNTIVLLPTIVINSIYNRDSKHTDTIQLDKEVKPPPAKVKMVQYLQHIAASSTLMVHIFITMISFVMAHTIMTMLLGDGKYNYVPKRLRWNQARVQRIYRKARNRWKMSTMWLVIWGAMSTIGSSIKLSSVNVETYTFEQ